MEDVRELLLLLHRIEGLILSEQMSSDDRERLKCFLSSFDKNDDTVSRDMMRYLILGFFASQFV